MLYYLEHFAIFIERNIIKDSNYCCKSLAIDYGLRTLNTLYQVTGYPNYRVSMNDPQGKIVEKLNYLVIVIFCPVVSCRSVVFLSVVIVPTIFLVCRCR